MKIAVCIGSWNAAIGDDPHSYVALADKIPVYTDVKLCVCTGSLNAVNTKGDRNIYKYSHHTLQTIYNAAKTNLLTPSLPTAIKRKTELLQFTHVFLL